MWRHNLLSFYRAITRHWLYAGLNVIGLAIGIAVFLALSLYVAFQTSFETWIPDARSIYVVHTTLRSPGFPEFSVNASMGALLEELKADYPQLLGTVTSGKEVSIRPASGGEPERVELSLVDANFFRVFDLPLVAGDKAHLLSAPDQVLISQSRAQRTFGAANPIGQPLAIAFDGAVHPYRVVGVLKDRPKNSDLAFDVVVPLSPQMSLDQKNWRDWESLQVTTYLRFDTAAQAAALNAELDRFTDRHAVADDLGRVPHQRIQLGVVRLIDQHLRDPKDAAAVVALAAVGALALLLAAVNYVNLATARAGLRAKEVALRKTMGSTRIALIVQFMAEALVMTSLAALIGLALCELALPAINAAGGLSLKVSYLGEASIIPRLIGVILVVGVGAGAYPALVLSRFQPAGVLASARSPAGGRGGGRMREALVGVQFTLAIIFIVGVGVITAQAHLLHHGDLGFDRSNLILVESFGDAELSDAQRTALIEVWRVTPGVAGVTASTSGPSDYGTMHQERYSRPGAQGGPTLNVMQTWPGFTETYGAHLVAGRSLDPRRGMDLYQVRTIDNGKAQPQASPPSGNVVINTKAVQALGFRTPQAAIGQTILEGVGSEAGADRIVGVVKDMRFRPPRYPIMPTVYYLRSQGYVRPVATVRYGGGDPRAVLDRLHAGWRRVAPERPFRAEAVEDSLDAYYRADDQRDGLFSAGAVLAVIIGCLGLFGLASSTAERRVREIGIRKTLGASTADVLRLLLGQFLRPVLLANLIAWPLAYLLMRDWLAGFDQRIALTPIYFLGATLLTLMIAVLTVLVRAIRVARSSPALALRYE